ncbi:MAG TPA: cyclopropane fatty acyl phospholipid synthase, partial [Spongiibacteraceae bacterium]|nr:cyclopropane fatty acyl phospholipid synthase [Spongiibacteraceae bacterium]
GISMHNRAQQNIENLLQQANIVINGSRPWDIQVFDQRFFSKVVAKGTLGLGEAYMDAWWDCPRVDEFIYRSLANRLKEKIRVGRQELWLFIRSCIINLQSSTRAFMVGKTHYDINAILYECMLDRRMTYTCGYWKNAIDLEQAQRDKLDLVCRKIDLQPGDRVLDIGCGWGSFAQYAAQNYGANVVGITISQQQVELARQRCAGLPVEIRLQDYRDLDETFDHIVSLGMFEHVGHKNYRTFMAIARACLRDSGLFLLHTIGSNDSAIASDPWIEKYIFPNGLLPSIAQIGNALENNFVIEDWHNFGADYDRTLMAWHGNFSAHWSDLQNYFDERFYRMWSYYLLACAGSFRARQTQLWQIVLSKHGIPGGYNSIR